ncbi:hypothetical protein HPB50_014841 [Hyalomma asiaticum]|uniref:Uncharacterized protein n=1 Tax=Hyalomma asiaticum TaxID=266040 RepID=A0ACB7SYF5_HYAAI|nr:hypothetical protein HPB50_014841 [Hyalomma asiaticum]
MCGVAGVASPRDPRSFFASCGAPCRTYSVVSLSSLCCRRSFNFVPVPAHSVARPWVHQSCEVVLCRVVGFGSGTECEAEVIPAGLSDALDNVSFDDYVDVDNSAVVCGTITDDDIIAQVTGGEEPVVEADKNDEQEEAPTRPSASQLLEAMGVARLFFSFEEGEEDAF